MNTFFRDHLSGWTLSSGLSAADDDDQRRLERFLDKYPAFLEAEVRRIHAEAAARILAAMHPSHVRSPVASPSSGLAEAPPASPPAPSQLLAAPPSPARMSLALQRFSARKTGSSKARTIEDQVRLLNNLVKHAQPRLGPDPWVHELQTQLIADFIDSEAARPGKRARATDAALGAAPPTTIKKILDLRVFFSYAQKELKAVVANPLDDFDERLRDLKKAASRVEMPYLPFADTQVATIFDPPAYLRNNREPDFFWCPLLGAHLGVRLGEIVLTRLDCIAQDAEGLWYLDVPLEHAKNSNSIRRLPITQPLMDLGFIEYVQHVRGLGATHLWPHRNLASRTAKSKPSKRQSEAFARHLDHCGIVDPQRVFHSWRHGVVTALLDGGTPLHISMQLCGHEAQEHAVRSGAIKASALRSVHLTTYTHADSARQGITNPLRVMKEALERCVRPNIDYTRLAIAARIVLEHTRREGQKFRVGWPPQRESYTQEQLARLNWDRKI